MKRIFVIAVAAVFLLMPLMSNAESDQKGAGPPPVNQTLVPEGYFSIQLAEALKVGTPKSEAEAETMLTSAGIVPKNGWIADYPVTPDIIMELQQAINMAADSGKLAMKKDEALAALQNTETALGLPVVASGEGQNPPNPPAESYGQYSDPSVINDYYSDEGPPVVTYYAPPPDYYYLYAWVPFPFWVTGFWFPGFFVLNDFNTVVFFHGRRFACTNHFFDRGTHHFGRIDPRTRTVGRDFGSGRNLNHERGFRTTQARNGAAAIFNRSIQHTRTASLGRNSFANNGQRFGAGTRTQTGPGSMGRSQSGSRPSLGRSSFEPSTEFWKSRGNEFPSTVLRWSKILRRTFHGWRRLFRWISRRWLVWRLPRRRRLRRGPRRRWSALKEGEAGRIICAKWPLPVQLLPEKP